MLINYGHKLQEIRSEQKLPSDHDLNSDDDYLALAENLHESRFRFREQIENVIVEDSIFTESASRNDHTAQSGDEYGHGLFAPVAATPYKALSMCEHPL